MKYILPLVAVAVLAGCGVDKKESHDAAMDKEESAAMMDEKMMESETTESEVDVVVNDLESYESADEVLAELDAALAALDDF